MLSTSKPDMATHHKRGNNVSVLRADGHATHFSVVHRNCAEYEPGWVCVREGSGRSAEAVAMMFNEEDAQNYCDWRTKKGQPSNPLDQINPVTKFGSKEHLEALQKIRSIVASGWAGVMPNGEIVDRRDYPTAVPIPANSLFGTPKPKKVRP
jgi:hypothetical protein